MHDTDYASLITKIEKDVRRLGARVMDLGGKIPHSTKTHAYDLLTDIDAEVENELKEILAILDPHTPVVGEETGGDRNVARYWLIDPIDGTIHFVRGNPFCTIMMALIEDGIPTVSIIYNVATQEFYSAIKGQGSYKNGIRISTSPRDITEAVVLTEINIRKTDNLQKLHNIATKTKVMNLVCAGYEFAMVADGRAEARVCIDPFGNDYDFAAGSLLVQESGGVAKTFDGENYDVNKKNFVVASSLKMYYDIVKIINTEKAL
jgi:myo-inositol-1(or 4)-monophosphatase